METGMPNVIKIGLQIEALAVQGLIFELLMGGFFTFLFVEFSVGPSRQTFQKFDLCDEGGARGVWSAEQAASVELLN